MKSNEEIEFLIEKRLLELPTKTCITDCEDMFKFIPGILAGIDLIKMEGEERIYQDYKDRQYYFEITEIRKSDGSQNPRYLTRFVRR